jgi:hypothetical protein
MVQDSMRTGPRGSSDQEALLKPITVRLSHFNGSWQVPEASAVIVDKFRSWTPLPHGSEAGYRVDRIWIVIGALYAAEGENFTIGTFTKNAAGAFVAVDADAFCTVQYFVNGTALGLVVVQTLNGAGAGKDPTLTANANFLIGGPNNHYLGVQGIATGSTGVGSFGVVADLTPVSGTKFTNK